MRSILLHIANDETLDARTQVALDIARAFGSHLSCLQPVPYAYAVPGDFYGTLVVDLVPQLDAAADELRERCELRLRTEDVAWSWDRVDGLALDALVRASALNDVVIAGSREPLSSAPSQLVGRLATRARAPLLLVPKHVNGLTVEGTALVAWNGSAEASQALKAAVPLLARARTVLLASVAEEADEAFDLPAIEGAQYLSRHGIACEMTEFHRDQGSVATMLADVAARCGAAYLVMGAYGRTRLAETVLGGVSRTLLTDPPLPILTCH